MRFVTFLLLVCALRLQHGQTANVLPASEILHIVRMLNNLPQNKPANIRFLHFADIHIFGIDYPVYRTNLRETIFQAEIKVYGQIQAANLYVPFMHSEVYINNVKVEAQLPVQFIGVHPRSLEITHPLEIHQVLPENRPSLTYQKDTLQPLQIFLNSVATLYDDYCSRMGDKFTKHTFVFRKGRILLKPEFRCDDDHVLITNEDIRIMDPYLFVDRSVKYDRKFKLFVTSPEESTYYSQCFVKQYRIRPDLVQPDLKLPDVKDKWIPLIAVKEDIQQLCDILNCVQTNSIGSIFVSNDKGSLAFDDQTILIAEKTSTKGDAGTEILVRLSGEIVDHAGSRATENLFFSERQFRNELGKIQEISKLYIKGLLPETKDAKYVIRYMGMAKITEFLAVISSEIVNLMDQKKAKDKIVLVTLKYMKHSVLHTRFSRKDRSYGFENLHILEGCEYGGKLKIVRRHHSLAMFLAEGKEFLGGGGLSENAFAIRFDPYVKQKRDAHYDEVKIKRDGWSVKIKYQR